MLRPEFFSPRPCSRERVLHAASPNPFELPRSAAGEHYARGADFGGGRERSAATSEGAAKITAFFETYAGKAAATPPALVVTPEGTDYLVTADIGALMAPLKSAGLNYDSAVFNFKVFEQDDAAWRVEQDNFPPYHVQMTQNNVTTDVAVSVSGLKSVTLLDTALGWIEAVNIMSTI